MLCLSNLASDVTEALSSLNSGTNRGKKNNFPGEKFRHLFVYITHKHIVFYVCVPPQGTVHAAEDNEINPDAAEDSKYIKTKVS